MEEERVRLLELFDFYWFHHHVLLHRPLPAVPLPASHADLAEAAPAAGAEAVITGTPHMPRHRSPLLRSLSDELAFASASASASDSALLSRRNMKLQTILSGKATSEEEAEYTEVATQRRTRAEKSQAEGDEINRGHRERKKKHRERRAATKGTSQGVQSKSLSELEFEELKGFMDLGFTFPDPAESDRRLLSIVPGLRRRGSSEEGVQAKECEEAEGGGGEEEAAISRPYLSEAWDAVADRHERRRSHAHDYLLRNWRVPAVGEGVDMKDHLRSWAHTVASAVR